MINRCHQTIKCLALFCVIVLLPSAPVPLAAVTVPAEEPAASVLSKDAVLQAVADLRADPLGPASKKAVEAIMAFAYYSDDVSVVINRRYRPWPSGGMPEVAEERLIGAFVAGNIEYQLTHGVLEQRPYEGTVLQLQVYEALRAAGAAPVINRFDKLLEFQAKGTLQDKVK